MSEPTLCALCLKNLASGTLIDGDLCWSCRLQKADVRLAVLGPELQALLSDRAHIAAARALEDKYVAIAASMQRVREAAVNCTQADIKSSNLSEYYREGWNACVKAVRTAMEGG